MIRVVLDGLVKRYEGIAVVDGASLEVRPGELTFLLGPSGAGKTTLARLVAGLEEPDAGDIYFDGRVMQALPPQERRVGLVFQDDALWPHLTVAENVAYGLKVQGIERRERRRRVTEALGLVGIESLADRRPDTLNPLQRQRAALARALVIDPHLLILDEPLAKAEPRLRAEFRDEIRRLHAEAETTTLILSHDPREALALADHLTVMDLGRVVQEGPPHEVYNRPADAFVAQFLGPANLLQAQFEGYDARGEAIVRTPIGRLIGQAPPELIPEGIPVIVVIRPEALSIAPAVPPGSNRFAATVERQVFLGETRQLHLRGPGDWPITALALQSQSNGLREGQNLTLSVPPEQVIVLPSKFAGEGR
ncbi:MAG: ABC transporter ATP-binding protein [Isosphaeraceae bacterium]|nr:ABC transporter ATP-binding protein [Isosphaeraceae bacterium]